MLHSGASKPRGRLGRIMELLDIKCVWRGGSVLRNIDLRQKIVYELRFTVYGRLDCVSRRFSQSYALIYADKTTSNFQLLPFYFCLFILFQVRCEEQLNQLAKSLNRIIFPDQGN